MRSFHVSAASCGLDGVVSKIAVRYDTKKMIALTELLEKVK